MADGTVTSPAPAIDAPAPNARAARPSPAMTREAFLAWLLGQHPVLPRSFDIVVCTCTDPSCRGWRVVAGAR
jgi:hypothetical protein